jgi:hypothetical protein
MIYNNINIFVIINMKKRVRILHLHPSFQKTDKSKQYRKSLCLAEVIIFLFNLKRMPVEFTKI